MSETVKVIGVFLGIFAVLWCAWYFTGGPAKEDSNKAYIRMPQQPWDKSEKFGDINSNVLKVTN